MLSESNKILRQTIACSKCVAIHKVRTLCLMTRLENQALPPPLRHVCVSFRLLCVCLCAFFIRSHSHAAFLLSCLESIFLFILCFFLLFLRFFSSFYCVRIWLRRVFFFSCFTFQLHRSRTARIEQRAPTANTNNVKSNSAFCLWFFALFLAEGLCRFHTVCASHSEYFVCFFLFASPLLTYT